MNKSSIRVSKLKLSLFLLWMVVVELGGCALFKGPLPEAGLEEERWLAALHRKGWALRGRIGVQGGGDSWHGSLQWQYRPGYDVLKISGPFGQGGVVVEVKRDWIRLTRHDGQVQESNRPPVLLHQLLGVAVPLDKLHFWLLGVPAPGPVQLRRYGPDRRVNVLSQAGWRIEYQRYQSVDSGVLPEKLIMKGPEGVRVKLIIDHWETGLESRST